mgnify:CR=1
TRRLTTRIKHTELFPVDDMIPHGFPEFQINQMYGSPAHIFPPGTEIVRDCPFLVGVGAVNRTPPRNQRFFYCW